MLDRRISRGEERMKIHPINLAIASGLAFAVIWLICSALVVALPDMADVTYRGMMHAGNDMPSMHVTMSGFWFGLVGWTLSAAVTTCVLAVSYNAMTGSKSAP
jgi:hypothetical protein